jgi:hypothetical protein
LGAEVKVVRQKINLFVLFVQSVTAHPENSQVPTCTYATNASEAPPTTTPAAQPSPAQVWLAWLPPLV